MHDGTGDAHGAIGHIVPAALLVKILLALLVLTVITVAVSYLDLGPLNLAVALGVAVIKASLVVLFFMHLRWDKPFNAVVFVSTLLFLGLFIGFSLLDTLEYQHQIIPDFGKEAFPQFPSDTAVPK